MDFLLIFLEGILAFISPCVLPMLPVYVSYFAGTSDEDERKHHTLHTLIRALSFVLGLTVVYALLGITAGTFGGFLSGHRTYVNIVCGLFIVFFGLCFLDVIKLSFLKGVNTTVKINGVFSAFLFGVIYSISLSPCTGVFLGSALSLAANSGGSFRGALLLVTYSLGMGIPFALSAILLGKLRGAFTFIKKHYRTVNIICGCFLILIGIAMMTGILDRLMLQLRAIMEG